MRWSAKRNKLLANVSDELSKIPVGVKRPTNNINLAPCQARLKNRENWGKYSPYRHMRIRKETGEPRIRPGVMEKVESREMEGRLSKCLYGPNSIKAFALEALKACTTFRRFHRYLSEVQEMLSPTALSLHLMMNFCVVCPRKYEGSHFVSYRSVPSDRFIRRGNRLDSRGNEISRWKLIFSFEGTSQTI